MVYTFASMVLTIVSCQTFHLPWSLIGLPTAFQKVLEFNEPTSIVAIPEYDKFIVHCESALSSFPLELVIRVSQGDAASKPSLDESEEKLSKNHGDVLFFKAGRIGNQTLSK